MRSCCLSAVTLGCGQAANRCLFCRDTPPLEHVDVRFSQFLAMQPASLRARYSTEQIRQWFREADLDGNGVLSVNEFFRYSLANAIHKYGADALNAVFREYDTNRTGTLDGAEFAALAAKLGFGTVAHNIFRDLDINGTGALSYSEVIHPSSHVLQACDHATKSLLISLAHTLEDSKEQTRVRTRAGSSTCAVDTSGWIINGRDAASVQAELRALLRQSGALVADIVRLFDDDATTAVGVDYMRKGHIDDVVRAHGRSPLPRGR